MTKVSQTLQMKGFEYLSGKQSSMLKPLKMISLQLVVFDYWLLRSEGCLVCLDGGNELTPSAVIISNLSVRNGLNIISDLYTKTV